MNNTQIDLIIIGAGPGGYVAAIKAAKNGLNVTLIDGNRVGGTCLNVGCIPTKALVKSAETYQSILNSEHIGIQVENIKLDMNQMIEHKNYVTEKLVSGVEFLLDKYGVEVIKGFAQFVDNKTIKVNNQTYTANNIVIATGAITKHLPIEGVDLDFVVDSTKLLDNKVLPTHLTVIGGGVIGMEFAFIYASLGAKVSVIEYMDHVLPNLDKEFSMRLTRYAKNLGIQFITKSAVTKIAVENDIKKVYYEQKGNQKSIETDLVLEAVGRIPNMNHLGLEHTGIDYDLKKGIKVNEKMQTNIPHIYAIGDVTNIIQLAHVASHQGMVAVENILGHHAAMDYSAVPSVTFTTPTIATVGTTEAMAKEQALEVDIIKVPFSANGKALISEAEAGYLKLIRNKETKELIGGMVFGKDADSLIAQITIAIKNKLSAKQLQETIFAHPTVSELIHEAALGLDGEAIHFLN